VCWPFFLIERITISNVHKKISQRAIPQKVQAVGLGRPIKLKFRKSIKIIHLFEE
jgi:hypothetical protein